MAGAQGSRGGDRIRQVGWKGGGGGCDDIKALWRSGWGGEVTILQEWRRGMDRDARSSKTASLRTKRWYLIIAAAAAVVEAVPAA